MMISAFICHSVIRFQQNTLSVCFRPLKRHQVIMYLFLCSFFLLFTASKCVQTLCDELSLCVCRYMDDGNTDFLKLDVDCSYNEGLLNSTYELPQSIYALDLSSNELTDIIPHSLLQSRTLETLYLNKNSIKNVDVNAFLLPELKQLDLSNNQLALLDPEVFQRTKKLEYLNLSSNNFITFAPMTFRHLTILKELVLDNNNVGKVLREVNLFERDGLALTTKIRNISLRNVTLNQLPENFFLNAYDLRRVTISLNNMSVIPELPFTIEYLDLSDNPITEIVSEDFSELPALKELRLNNLQIKEVPEYAFASMKGLVKLELERNINLIKFSELAFGNEVLDDADYFALEELSLRGSRVTTIAEELEIPFGHLMKLDLQGNPWKCDCKLAWVKRLQISPEDSEHLRCASPTTYFNTKLFDLRAKHFKCTVPKDYLIGMMTALVFCVILTSIALWLFFCLPRYQNRCEFMSGMYSPATTYTLLPINGYNNDRY